ncbi:peptide chain release factor N(5)-glutamine methyltransferase [Methylocella sp.]|uniref:peptide chain release factor N(5)-glutamine methyltransferase n=1 Tax=Methylocella sp. TaxID=1978226 RepID=UPI003784896D
MTPAVAGAAAEFAPDAAQGREAARRALAAALRASGVATPDLDARLLLFAALDIDHATLIRDPDAPLGAAGAVRLQGLARRRLAREPVSRILGAREFWGASFRLGAATLDPRPDTETLVEAVLERVGPARDRDWRILDLGAGSGAILAALLLELPNAFGVGVDRSFEACALARENLRRLGLGPRAAIAQADWAAPLSGAFDLVVSNPPYIAHDDIATLAPEARLYDPMLALDGGMDGLDAYRALIPQAFRLLGRGGLLALEIGCAQAREVDALLCAAGFGERRLRLDLNGLDRIILAETAS